MFERNHYKYPSSPEAIAALIDLEMRNVPVSNALNLRAVRRKYSQELREAEAGFVLDVARCLIQQYQRRWVAYELISCHEKAFALMGRELLEELGQGIDSWYTVDSFARTLAGPVWLEGQVSDSVIYEWACSVDLWWRRAALVSTVALNVRSHGGKGDASRTLAVCRLLVDDHEDMVVKAMSWALRELVIHDPTAVKDFINEHEKRLSPRIKREVNNKLRSGLKYPKQHKDQ
jgi:3-methyladenine DNA glycosylase AlkD